MTKAETILIAIFLSFIGSVIGYFAYLGYTECTSKHLREHNGPYKLGCELRE